MKSAVVVLEKLASENNMITDQPSSPESPSLLATRKRKMSKPGDVNSKPPQASGSYVKVPQSKKPTISPSSSESETESYDSLRLDLFYKYKQPQESSNNPDGQLSPIQSFSPESQKSTPRRNTPSPNLSENISPEHTPPPGRPLFTPSPSRSQVIQPQDAPGERQPPVRNEVRDSRDAPGDVPQPPIRNEIDGEPQDAADQEQLPIQNEDIIEVQDPVNREQPQNGHQSPPQNEPRPRRIKYYKMTEYVKNCVEYYAKRGEPGNREMRRRYNIAFGNELYLGEDISVNLLQWELLQRHKPQVFLIELAVLIWGERNLCNRALDLTRGVENIPNRSPVKLIEKDILRLLISLYNDFLNNHKYPSDEKASYLLRATHVLRHKIRDLRAAEKNKFQLPNVNAQRRLRYNVRD
ncbi:pollen-specific leucine-rich repeat extensin-like protein 1 [Nasonia vitripennis]|nr:pollen-specific leucine-rich repeat extensin-like protein 1 [Nasonia vitripennis]